MRATARLPIIMSCRESAAWGLHKLMLSTGELLVLEETELGVCKVSINKGDNAPFPPISRVDSVLLSLLAVRSNVKVKKRLNALDF
jgi:hypothetical protein